MVLTRDAAIAARVRSLSTQARSDPLEWVHDEIGFNYRLTNLQAAVGAAQLEQLEDFLDRKRQTAVAYTQAFERVDGVTPFREAPWARTNWWLPTVLVDAATLPRRPRPDPRPQRRRHRVRPLWHPLHRQPPFRDARVGTDRGRRPAVGPRSLPAVLGRHHGRGAPDGDRRTGRPPGVSAVVELRERLRRYYTAYYRDTLGIPGWPTLVDLREEEEAQERAPLRAPPRRLSARRRWPAVCSTWAAAPAGSTRWPAAEGIRIVGVDADAEAIAICGAKRRTPAAPTCTRRPSICRFATAAFDVVYCFSVIEHVASVEATVAEMVRVTRPGGAIYVHTPNAWSWWEGHYKVFWAPFMPRPVARTYLRLRGRPTAYLATLRRLTVARLRRAFARAGVPVRTLHDDTPARESVGPLRRLIRRLLPRDRRRPRSSSWWCASRERVVIKTILFATEYYPPFAPGGAEWTNAAWASALARAGVAWSW